MPRGSTLSCGVTAIILAWSGAVQAQPATTTSAPAAAGAAVDEGTGANDNGPFAYITDWANNDVRTEGMSYGMMIAVQLGEQRYFDGMLYLMSMMHLAGEFRVIDAGPK